MSSDWCMDDRSTTRASILGGSLPRINVSDCISMTHSNSLYLIWKCGGLWSSKYIKMDIPKKRQISGMFIKLNYYKKLFCDLHITSITTDIHLFISYYGIVFLMCFCKICRIFKKLVARFCIRWKINDTRASIIVFYIDLMVLLR